MKFNHLIVVLILFFIINTTLKIQSRKILKSKKRSLIKDDNDDGDDDDDNNNNTQIKPTLASNITQITNTNNIQSNNENSYVSNSTNYELNSDKKNEINNGNIEINNNIDGKSINNNNIDEIIKLAENEVNGKIKENIGIKSKLIELNNQEFELKKNISDLEKSINDLSIKNTLDKIKLSTIDDDIKDKDKKLRQLISDQGKDLSDWLLEFTNERRADERAKFDTFYDTIKREMQVYKENLNTIKKQMQDTEERLNTDLIRKKNNIDSLVSKKFKEVEEKLNRADLQSYYNKNLYEHYFERKNEFNYSDSVKLMTQ